jgi:SPP1 gp7 family putative phage head morphogenesis protein
VASSINQELLDFQITHYSYLERYKNTLVREIVSMFRTRRRGLIRQLAEEPLLKYERRRFERELRYWDSILTEQDALLAEALEGNLEEFLSREAAYQGAMIGRAGPMLDINIPSATQMATAARLEPFEGLPINQHIQNTFGNSRARFLAEVRQGYAFGVPTERIAENLSAALNMDINRVRNITRSAVGHMASIARKELYEQNSDVIEYEQWVSTLDTRTTPICQVMDGALRKIGESEWSNGQYGEPGQIHWGCRSTSIPIIKDWRALGLDDPPAGVRASLDGGVPDSTTYQEWLAGQTQARQEEVLGIQRAELFREGKLSLAEMVRDGRYITLDELMK